MPASPAHSGQPSLVACLQSSWQFLRPMVTLSPWLVPLVAGGGPDPCTPTPPTPVMWGGAGSWQMPHRYSTPMSEHCTWSRSVARTREGKGGAQGPQSEAGSQLGTGQGWEGERNGSFWVCSERQLPGPAPQWGRRHPLGAPTALSLTWRMNGLFTGGSSFMKYPSLPGLQSN